MAHERELGPAEDVVSICRSMLPPLTAVIVHGSLALGDFGSGQSDVDVLAIADERPSADDLEQLIAAMTGLRSRAVAAVDLRVITRDVAAAPTTAPRMEIYVRIDPGADSGVEVEEGRPERDLVIELSVCRSHGTSLFGPPPAGVIGEVPDEWVIGVGQEVLANWQGRPYDPTIATLMVMTACRVWRFAEERVHCSKPEAACWVLTRDPSSTAVRAALEGGSIEESDVRELLYVVQTATRNDQPRRPGLAGT